MKTLIGHRFQAFVEPGSMGVVTDTRFVRCYWPPLDRPNQIFAEGSSGLSVLGSSRNVVWPKDTVFESYYPDALYPAELAALEGSGKRGLVNLTDEEAARWLAAYDAAVATFPQTHAVHSSRDDVHFLVHKEPSADPKKPTRYVAELTKVEVVGLIDGKVSETDLRDAKEFVKADDPTVVLVKGG